MNGALPKPELMDFLFLVIQTKNIMSGSFYKDDVIGL